MKKGTLNELLSVATIALNISINDVESVLSIVLTIINIVILVLSFAIYKLVPYIKKITADKKITKDEIKEGIDLLSGLKEELKENTKQKEDK